MILFFGNYIIKILLLVMYCDKSFLNNFRNETVNFAKFRYNKCKT